MAMQRGSSQHAAPSLTGLSNPKVSNERQKFPHVGESQQRQQPLGKIMNTSPNAKPAFKTRPDLSVGSTKSGKTATINTG